MHVILNLFPGLAYYSNGLCREHDIRHRRVKMECLGDNALCIKLHIVKLVLLSFLVKKVFPMLYYKLGGILALKLHSG